MANDFTTPADHEQTAGDDIDGEVKVRSLRKLEHVRLGSVASDSQLWLLRRDKGWNVRSELKRNKGTWTLQATISPNLKLWRHHWSPAEYRAAAGSWFAASEYGFELTVRPRSYFVGRKLDDLEMTIKSALELPFTAHRTLVSRLTEDWNSQRPQDDKSVVTQFTFAPEVRSACEQYLLHFVDFLRDLGIEAHAELRETASSVLFSVTPADRTDALDRIRVALAAYLKLPGAEIARTGDESIVATKLEMTIAHLKAQLAAADAQRMYLQAAIEAQRYSIIALRQLTDGGSSEESSRDVEPIVGDLVSLKKLEYGPVEVNLPEFVRKVKRFLK
jgi:hypothetical protein